MAGCNVLGVMGGPDQSGEGNTTKHAKPQYFGLEGKSVAIMVWADRAAKVEWPSIQLDLASKIQNKLYGNKAKELKGTTWPVQPSSVVRYQLDHPEIEAMSILEVAPKLGVSRLIYVEIESFSTRSEASMYRGNVSATLKIIEVTGGQAKIGYEQSGIKAFFPAKSTPEGVFNSTDAIMYRGVIGATAEAITDRLASRDDDD